MLIRVSDIPAEGLRVEVSEEETGFAGLGEDVRLVGPVQGDFSLKVTGATVVVTGKVGTDVELDCSRCGKTFRTRIEVEFSEDLNPVESLADEEEKELHAGDMDAGFYSGGEVDLSALLAEQLALNLPMQPLCSEGCRGVCQFCGQDLNERECGCEPPSGHPGLEGLKELLERMKREGVKEDGESN